MSISRELEQARAIVEQLQTCDREDEQATAEAVRTGDAALAGRMAARWSATRAELIRAQQNLRRIEETNQ